MLYLLIYLIVYLLYWMACVVAGKANFFIYDLWIGIYVDTKNRRTYWAGLPCFVIFEEWAPPEMRD